MKKIIRFFIKNLFLLPRFITIYILLEFISFFLKKISFFEYAHSEIGSLIYIDGFLRKKNSKKFGPQNRDFNRDLNHKNKNKDSNFLKILKNIFD